MSYEISIDHELKIIRYSHPGIIDAADIGNAWGEFLKMQEFTQLKYNLLSDYREGKFNISKNKLSEIVGFLFSIKEVLKGKKQALIVDDPYSVAMSMLFKEDVYKEVGFDVKVFSTEASAIDWLKT